MATKKIKSRVRMTDQDVVNVKAAEEAVLHVSPSGGYRVTLIGKEGATIDLSRTYPSKVEAKKALQRHNPDLEPSLSPQI